MEKRNKSGKSARILIVEDDLATGMIMGEALSQDNNSIFIAETGELALEKVISWNPQLIICDLNLPDISGINVMKKIRSLKNIPFIPSIIVTSDSNPATIVSCLQFAEEYLIKPANPIELRARVRSMLRLKQLQDKNNWLNASLEKRILKKTSELIKTNLNLKKEIERGRKSREEIRKLSEILKNLQETERSKFARDIHDAIGTSLLTLKLMIQSEARNAKVKNKGITQSIKLIDTIAESIRSVSHSIYPASLARIGLLESVREWIAGLNETHLSIKFKIKSKWDEKHLPGKSTLELYRILQEAVINAIKHSSATLISIDMISSTKGFKLRVSDNGVGFADGKRKGIGLLVMQERSVLLGCSFSINSRINKGTEVLLICENKSKK